MAEALYLVSRSQSVGLRTVNGVQAVVINKDDGQTDAQIIADAVAQTNAAFAGTNSTSPYDADYFDTVTKISDLSTGPLKDNKDAYVFRDGGGPVKVEG